MSTETYLQTDASRIACDVFVREKVLGPEDVLVSRRFRCGNTNVLALTVSTIFLMPPVSHVH